jgi:hypothetical protein
MRVEVEGWDDDVEIDLIQQFVRYSIYSLVDDDTADKLTILIAADLSLLAENRWADVTAKNDGILYPTDFTIRLARHGLSVLEQLMVLGHEVTHIKQFCTGEWRILDFTQHWWQGQVIDSTYLDDWFEPWEIEARGREKGHLERFVKFYQYQNAPWYKPRP